MSKAKIILTFFNIWSGSQLEMGRAENLIDILRLFVAVLQMSILQKEQKLVFDISWFLPQKHPHTQKERWFDDLLSFVKWHRRSKIIPVLLNWKVVDVVSKKSLFWSLLRLYCECLVCISLLNGVHFHYCKAIKASH